MQILTVVLRYSGISKNVCTTMVGLHQMFSEKYFRNLRGKETGHGESASAHVDCEATTVYTHGRHASVGKVRNPVTAYLTKREIADEREKFRFCGDERV